MGSTHYIMCLSTKTLFLFTIVTVSLSQAKSHTDHKDRTWNVCSGAEDYCRAQCANLSPSASCSCTCGLFQVKTWTCDQLVGRNGDNGPDQMVGYTSIKEQGY